MLILAKTKAVALITCRGGILAGALHWFFEPYIYGLSDATPGGKEVKNKEWKLRLR